MAFKTGCRKKTKEIEKTRIDGRKNRRTRKGNAAIPGGDCFPHRLLGSGFSRFAAGRGRALSLLLGRLGKLNKLCVSFPFLLPGGSSDGFVLFFTSLYQALYTPLGQFRLGLALPAFAASGSGGIAVRGSLDPRILC